MSHSAPTKLVPGDVVAGQYRIGGVVGQGGFGAIYEATHVTTGQRVALKVLLASLTTSETDSKRFEREAALVQKLHHDNVVQLLDFGHTAEGLRFIAFELLYGRSLENVLERDGPLPVRRVAEIGRDVLLALSAAHRLGIVHRDIKPGNVFLCDAEPGARERTKVLDFGVAKATGDQFSKQTNLTRDGALVGTPFYMAPEQVRGAEVSAPTDLYALGLVMAEMLCGERVVAAPNVLAIYMAHAADSPVELPPSVAQTPLGPIVARAIEKPLARRYRSAREMLSDVEACLAQLGAHGDRGAAAGGRRAWTDTAPTAVMLDRRPQAETITAIRPDPRATGTDAKLSKTIPIEAVPPASSPESMRVDGPSEDDEDSMQATIALTSPARPVDRSVAGDAEAGGAGRPNVTRQGTELLPAMDPGVGSAAPNVAAAPPASAPPAEPPAREAAELPQGAASPGPPASSRPVAATVMAGPAQLSGLAPPSSGQPPMPHGATPPAPSQPHAVQSAPAFAEAAFPPAASSPALPRAPSSMPGVEAGAAPGPPSYSAAAGPAPSPYPAVPQPPGAPPAGPGAMGWTPTPEPPSTHSGRTVLWLLGIVLLGLVAAAIAVALAMAFG